MVVAAVVKLVFVDFFMVIIGLVFEGLPVIVVVVAVVVVVVLVVVVVVVVPNA